MAQTPHPRPAPPRAPLTAWSLDPCPTLLHGQWPPDVSAQHFPPPVNAARRGAVREPDRPGRSPPTCLGHVMGNLPSMGLAKCTIRAQSFGQGWGEGSVSPNRGPWEPDKGQGTERHTRQKKAETSIHTDTGTRLPGGRRPGCCHRPPQTSGSPGAGAWGAAREVRVTSWNTEAGGRGEVQTHCHPQGAPSSYHVCLKGAADGAGQRGRERDPKAAREVAILRPAERTCRRAWGRAVSAPPPGAGS